MLYERDSSLWELEHLLGQARSGVGHFALVAGEAGIGKSSLLRAFIEQLPVGVRVIQAACEDLTTPEPLGLLYDLRLPVTGNARIQQFASALDQLALEPTVLALEDLHWADDASIDFVRYLGRRLADKPLLIVGTSRDDDDDSRARLRRIFNDLPASARSRLDLQPLTSGAVRDMVRDAGLLSVPVYDLTAGNPLLVTEVIAARDPTSSNISDLVLERADRLSADARAVLDFCAIIPSRVPNGLLESSGRTGAAVDECVESGLLVKDGDAYRFRHELTRHAVVHALRAGDASRYHQESFSLLEATGASAARLLHHASAAGLVDEIMRLAPLAASEAIASAAFRAAASALETMRPYVDTLDLDAQANFWHNHGDVLHLIDPAEATLSLLRAMRLYEQGAVPHETGRQRAHPALAYFLQGDRISADEIILATAAEMERQGDSISLASALVDLSQFQSVDEEWDLVRDTAGRAMAIADRVGSERHALMARAISQTLIVPAPLEGDKAGFEKLLEECQSAGVPEDEISRINIYLANSEMLVLKFDDAIATLERGIAYMIDHDIDVWLGWARGCQAFVSVLKGETQAARRFAEISLNEQSIGPIGRSPANWALAALDIRSGLDGGSALGELEEHLGRGRDSLRFVPYAIMMAERAWTSGKDADYALALLDDAIASYGERQTPYRGGRLHYWRRTLDPSTAISVAMPMTDADHLLGAGDWQGAAAAWEQYSMPFERALALLKGDERAAREALLELERMEASATAARARSDLSARGLTVRGPRTSTVGNPFGLTNRELEVVRAMADGASNKDVARALSVSPKTVEHHVSSIFAKMEVNSRRKVSDFARSMLAQVDPR